MAYEGERVTFDQSAPIQAPALKRPWLFSVDEFGSQYGNDLGFAYLE
jgi:hypothetical protein